MKSAISQDIYLEIENYKRDIFEIIDQVKNYILNEDCPFLIVDITKLNLIDTTKVCIVCSTYHFTKYNDGNITWQVSNIEAQRLIYSLKLRNIRTEIKLKNNRTIEYFDKKYRASVR